MNDATAIAFCAGGSSGSGANHSVTGMATHKIRPISVRHENLAPSDAASGSTGFTIAANAACDCSSIAHYPFILTTGLGSLIEDFPPLLFGSSADSGARFGDWRKLAEPFIRPARIDNRARAQSLLPFRNDRIERPTP